MPEQGRKIGAVVVAGGGLGGVQASLVLAEMGYTVHLIERSERIGPSTSPGGDEPLCLLSCKTAEVTDHSRIHLMTRSEVIEVTGEAGSMKARIRRMNPGGEREEISLDIGAVVLTSDRASSSADRQCAAESPGLLRGAERARPFSASDPLLTSRPGIYACGLVADREDPHLLILEASAAAGMAADDLEKAGLSRNGDPPLPELPDRSTQPPRVGLFICECASRMAGSSDLHLLSAQGSTLPFIQHIRSFPLACRPEALEGLREAIREHRLNRIVVACSQSEARSLFLRTCQQEDIDSHLLHLVRIGLDSETKGTPSPEMVKDLIEDAVLQAALQQPRMPSVEGVVKTALVAGGGVAARMAALFTAKKGYRVHLVEKAERLVGGETVSGDDFQSLDQETIEGLRNDHRIVIHLSAQCLETSGYVGNFQTMIKTPGGEISISHGAAILSDQGSGERPEREGFFLAGPSESSRSNAEAVTLIRARAAAALASTILSKDRVLVRGVAPAVSRGKCAACLTCVRTCPCGVPCVDEKGCAYIEPAICKGCGTCVAECPGKAITMQQFTDEQMREKLMMARCSACGQPYLSAGRLEYLKRRLSAEDLQPLGRHLCPVCSRKKFVEDHFEVM